MGDEPTESLWVMINRQTNVDNTVVGVCYRPPDQEEVDEAFFRQLEEASRLQAPVLTRGF